MREIWKEIHGYEGIYAVSTQGDIYSIKRRKLRKLRKDKYGYMMVSLNKDGNIRTFFVHRLVAASFIDNPQNLTEVNHIDGNKENNCADNLEWCDHATNIRHAYATGLMPYQMKQDNKKLTQRKKNKSEITNQSKLTAEQVQSIRSEHIPFERGHGCKALAKKYGVTDSTIKQIINRKTWKGV